MILIIGDLLLSYFSKYPIFLFLLDIVFLSKNHFPKFIITSLIFDLLILNANFFPTFLLFLIFILYKKLPLTKKTFFNYFLSLTFIFYTFTIPLGLLNHYSLGFLLFLTTKYYLINLPIYIFCYKIFKSRIKLAR